MRLSSLIFLPLSLSILCLSACSVDLLPGQTEPCQGPQCTQSTPGGGTSTNTSSTNTSPKKPNSCIEQVSCPDGYVPGACSRDTAEECTQLEVAQPCGGKPLSCVLKEQDCIQPMCGQGYAEVEECLESEDVECREIRACGESIFCRAIKAPGCEVKCPEGKQQVDGCFAGGNIDCEVVSVCGESIFCIPEAAPKCSCPEGTLTVNSCDPELIERGICEERTGCGTTYGCLEEVTCEQECPMGYVPDESKICMLSSTPFPNDYCTKVIAFCDDRLDLSCVRTRECRFDEFCLDPVFAPEGCNMTGVYCEAFNQSATTECDDDQYTCASIATGCDGEVFCPLLSYTDEEPCDDGLLGCQDGSVQVEVCERGKRCRFRQSCSQTILCQEVGG